jgi:Na+-driven multidrug efflux pump
VGAEAIVSLFTTDATVTHSGAVFLRHVAPTFGFIGVVRVFTASFRGAGQTLTAAAIVLLMYGIIRLPIAQLGAVSIGSSGVWTAIAATNILGAVLAYGWYRCGTWRGTAETERTDCLDAHRADN